MARSSSMVAGIAAVSTSLLTVLSTSLALGCVGTELAEEGESVEQVLSSYVDKGEISFRETKLDTLSHEHLGHFYRFAAAPGQTVLFAVEWEIPQSDGLGAILQVRDATGSSILAEHTMPSSNQARVAFSFLRADTYRIYVAQHESTASGSYAYKVGAQPDLCYEVEGTYSGFESGAVNFAAACNFPESLTTSPWLGVEAEEGYVPSGHKVTFGNCADLVGTCPSDGPGIVESWFPSGTLRVVPNECQMWNDVFRSAGTEGCWFLWWATRDEVPEVCPPR